LAELSDTPRKPVSYQRSNRRTQCFERMSGRHPA